MSVRLSRAIQDDRFCAVVGHPDSWTGGSKTTSPELVCEPDVGTDARFFIPAACDRVNIYHMAQDRSTWTSICRCYLSSCPLGKMIGSGAWKLIILSLSKCKWYKFRNRRVRTFLFADQTPLIDTLSHEDVERK